MVTSTSIPGSIDSWVIWRTVSVGDWRSITRLWILIWYLSQVLEPSPFGVLRVVILKVFVGILTGPLTLRFLSRAALTNSFEMRSMAEQFFEVIVMRILCSYYIESKIICAVREKKCSRIITCKMRVRLKHDTNVRCSILFLFTFLNFFLTFFVLGWHFFLADLFTRNSGEQAADSVWNKKKNISSVRWALGFKSW